MKKKNIGIIIGIILVIVLFIICIAISPEEESTVVTEEDINAIISNAETESAAVKEEEKKDFININMDTYLEYYNGSEQKVILLARPTCEYCQIAEPILHKIAYEYDLEIYYLNTDEFSDEDRNNLVHSNDFFSEGFGTPLLFVVSDGGIKNKVDGLTDYNHYIAFFQSNGYIK